MKPPLNNARRASYGNRRWHQAAFSLVNTLPGHGRSLFRYIAAMTVIPDNLPARVWVVPHLPRTRGEPTARPLLSQALQCEASALPLHRDPGGRPRLGAPYTHFDTGWSHSGEALVLALGESVQLGVDIERVRPRPRLLELAQRFFHVDETAWLHSQPEQAMVESFVRLWCAKEAVLKAHGQGLSFGLHKLVFTEQDRTLRLQACDAALGKPEDWRVHEWAPLSGYCAALAWRERPLHQVTWSSDPVAAT